MSRRPKYARGLLQQKMIALLEQRMNYENVSLADLARAVDTAYSSVRRTLKTTADRSVSVDILETYADALDMEFEVKLVRKK